MRIPGRKVLLHRARLVRSQLVNHGLILGYHRVNDLSWDPLKLSISPEHFAQQLAILQEYANVVPLHELVAAHMKGRIPPRSVAITFDDGYADYLSVARPLLEKASFHSTLFIATGYLGQEFWWDTLTGLVGALNPANTLVLEADGSIFKWRPEAETNTDKRTALLNKISRFFYPLSPQTRLECLQQLADSAGARITKPHQNLALSEQELIALAADDQVTLGCHTVSHAMLARLSTEQQRTEIIQSKHTLEALTGCPVDSFSYPNGSRSAVSVQLVQECGFTHACASQNDVVWRKSNPFCLPRLWPPDYAGEAFWKWLKRWL